MIRSTAEKKVITILGTRPDIVKLSPVLPLLDQRFIHRVVHTGQHYDYRMDGVFFSQFNLRMPDYNLNSGRKGLSHARQTAAMMIGIEDILLQENPDCVLVYADPNTPLAGALAASKLNIPIVHLEAGCRSGNRNMPEEINRILCDHCADLLLAPDRVAYGNLFREGLGDRTVVVGSTAVEACRRNYALAPPLNGFVEESHLKRGGYALLTLHRAETTDSAERLNGMLTAIDRAAAGFPVVFPIHPRTEKALADIGIVLRNITVIPAQGYLEFLTLLGNCRFVLSDSGGIQEEAAALDVPCFILRDDTEWTYLTDSGKNFLLGTDPKTIATVLEELLGSEQRLERMRNIRLQWDMNASSRIVQEVDRWLEEIHETDRKNRICPSASLSHSGRMQPVREAKGTRDDS